MKMLEYHIEKYLNELKTESPTPGGGSVAGITASQAIALNLMVINITLKNKRYGEYFTLNEELKKESEVLYSKIIETADKDVIAFERLAKAYKLPNESDEEKENKMYELGEASLDATKVPFEVIELCLEGIKITDRLLGNSSRMAISDLGVAAKLFESASMSAWLNVKINLPYLDNKKIARDFDDRGKELLDIISSLSDRIYKKVEESL